MIANIKNYRMTVEEYLVWEEEQPLRHEYIEGEAYAMTGGTMPHVDIAVNLTSLLRNFLRGTGCKVRAHDAKVKVSDLGPYFYPDLLVTCDERDRRIIKETRYPKLIMEVLSPSTAGFDSLSETLCERGDKFRFYRRLESLQEYALIDADKMAVDYYRRGISGRWELTSYPEDSEDKENPILELTSIDFQCLLALVYEEIEFPQALPRDDL